MHAFLLKAKHGKHQQPLAVDASLMWLARQGAE